jgi:hypothetical protein
MSQILAKVIHGQTVQHQNLIQRKRVSELKYLEEETISIDIEFDILQYWKMTSATYIDHSCIYGGIRISLF